MGIKDGELETFFVKFGHSEWKTIDDIFAWFDNRKGQKWDVISEGVRWSYWPEDRILRSFGMPVYLNLPIVEVVRSGWRLSEKFKDYIFFYLGVQADEHNPTIGQSDYQLVYFPPNRERLVIHVWGALLIARHVETRLLMIWHVGELRGNLGTRSYNAALKRMPKPHWWTELFNVSLSRPNDLIKLARGFELLDGDLEITKPGGDTRTQEIQQMWADVDILKGYARFVGELLSSWKWIKANVDLSASMSLDRQQKWVSEMWQRDEIKSFAAKHPKFTEKILARAVDNGLNKAHRQPVPLACFHAALEFEVTINGETLSIMDAYLKYEGSKKNKRNELSPSTLVTYYGKGCDLIEQSV